jgi:polysaccharide biosynthesis protein PslG
VNRLKLIVGIALSLTLVVGLALSLLSGAGTSSNQTATPTDQQQFFGITQGIRLDEEDFETMEETGVASNRVLLLWGSVQPSQGSFKWGPSDALVGALASHGIQAAPFVWGSPPWVASTIARPPLDGLGDVQAWQNFLEAAVARYGRGGIYWAKKYRQRYGPDAKPLPVHSWQIWNEPNLSKYFAPSPSVEQYARLLQISHSAIKSKDPQAGIVLAGMPGYGDVNAWDFLDSLYAVAGIKGDFDAVALHPYAPNLDELRLEIERLRAVMSKHGDRGTPLWLTELGWGSAPPDRFGLNKGVNGQERLLSSSFKLILRHRKAWTVERVFWFDWRDPIDPEALKCSFCGSAGLLTYNRTPKPAYHAFKAFAGVR